MASPVATRLVALLGCVVIVSGSLATVPPPAAATSRTTEPAPQAPEAARGKGTGGAVAVKPAPIRDARPAAAGSAGAVTDPSIGGEPVFTVPAVPRTRTEVAGRRTRMSRVYANPDGTYDLEIGSTPLHYRDADGRWRPIDLALASDGKGGWRARGATDQAAVTLRTTPSALLDLVGDAGTFRLRMAQHGYPDSGSATGSRVAIVGQGQPTVYAAPLDRGAEFGATFSEPAGPSSVTYALDGPAGSTAAVQPDGSIVLTSGKGAFIGRIDAPRLLAGPDASGVENTPVAVSVAAGVPAPSATVEPSAAPSAEPAASAAPSAESAPSAIPEPSANPEPAADPAPPAVGEPSANPEPAPSDDPQPSIPSAPTPSPSVTAPPSAPAPVPQAVASAAVASPSGRFDITYAIDRAFFTAADTPFPLVLDPAICVVRGGDTTYCTAETTNGAPDSYGTYVAAGQPATYPAGTGSMIRIGDDDNAVANDAGTNWGTMRSLVYIDTDGLDLPDGAMITSATLRLREDMNAGSAGARIYARLVKRPGFPGDATWNGHASLVEGSVYDSPAVAPCVGGGDGTNCYVYLDVSNIVRATMTRFAGEWKGGYGFQLRYDTEGNAYKETTFYRSDDASNPDVNRPVLRVTYEVVNSGFNLDPALGPKYAPSRMVAGVPTPLPVSLENKPGSAGPWNRCVSAATTDCYQVGYRFINARGKVAGSGVADLADDTVAVPSRSSTILLAINPPATPGQYTLRLDVVRRLGPNDSTRRSVWASDWADPSLYNARNKRILEKDFVRWTGRSKVERTEFTIDVGAGTIPGDPQTVPTGDGGQIGIDLATRNLTYDGGTGLGFADLLPIDLGYAYHSATAVSADPASAPRCAGYQGILGACGWTTSLDERLVGGPNRTGYDYGYVDPAGITHLADTDSAGQISSSAGVLLERERITFADEIMQLGAGGATVVTTPVYAGRNAIRFSQGNNYATGFPGAGSPVSLNPYPVVRFAARSTSGVSKVGLCFTIDNLTDPDVSDKAYCYRLGTGTAGWTIGDDRRDLAPEGGSASLSDPDWNRYAANLWDDVRSSPVAFGSNQDEYAVTAIVVDNDTAQATQYVYLDAARFEPRDVTVLEDAAPSWTSGGSLAHAVSGDVRSGTTAFDIDPASVPSSPTCDTTSGCWPTSAGATWSAPFASWWWRKTGGQTAAVAFRFSDETYGTDKGWIT